MVIFQNGKVLGTDPKEVEFQSLGVASRKDSMPRVVTASASQTVLAVSKRAIQVWKLGKNSGPFYTRDESGEAMGVCSGFIEQSYGEDLHP